jgi:hypothetical protein
MATKGKTERMPEHGCSCDLCWDVDDENALVGVPAKPIVLGARTAPNTLPSLAMDALDIAFGRELGCY